jgi:voltage-gated potassium channel
VNIPIGSSQPAYVTARIQRWRRLTDVPLLIVAIGSLPLLLLELQRSQLSYADRLFLDVTNVLVLVAFVVDYVVELTLCSDRAAYVRHEWTSLLIVVTQALAVIPALAGLGALRVLRGTRALRALVAVLRLFAIGGAAAQQGRNVLRQHAAGFALGLAGFTWLTSAAAFSLAEDVGKGHRIDSFFDALWWSTATITTVGYGDVFPITTAGRIVGGVTMVVGISTFAIVTAKVAEFLVRGAPAESGPAERPITTTDTG